MFREFRELIKKNGVRGWRLEDENGVFYLSKFDDRFNDDEFRFFLSIEENNIHIKKMQKIKSYKKIMNVNAQHEYTKQAESFCHQMNHILQITHA